MKRLFRYIIFVVCILFTLTGCDNVNTVKEEIKPIEAEWTLEESTGADIVELNYASEDKVIFHGCFGLFVYDLNTESITHSLDLRNIGCGATQGDSYCDVSVDQDGDIVQLHPLDSDKMYVYDIKKNRLQHMDYEPMKNAFKITPNENPQGGISYETVKFDNGDIGYLKAIDTTLNGLYYIVGDKEYKLFGAK